MNHSGQPPWTMVWRRLAVGLLGVLGASQDLEIWSPAPGSVTSERAVDLGFNVVLPDEVDANLCELCVFVGDERLLCEALADPSWPGPAGRPRTPDSESVQAREHGHHNGAILARALLRRPLARGNRAGGKRLGGRPGGDGYCARAVGTGTGAP